MGHLKVYLEAPSLHQPGKGLQSHASFPYGQRARVLPLGLPSLEEDICDFWRRLFICRFEKPSWFKVVKVWIIKALLTTANAIVVSCAVGYVRMEWHPGVLLHMLKICLSLPRRAPNPRRGKPHPPEVGLVNTCRWPTCQ